MKLKIVMTNSLVYEKEISNEQEVNVLRQSLKSAVKNGDLFFQINKTTELDIWVNPLEISVMVLDTTAPRQSRVPPTPEETKAVQDPSKGIQGIQKRPIAVKVGPRN